MAGEVGEAHPGFDCFAFRGRLRDRLFRYESCVGIGGVMLPLVHQLLAQADTPVVLLDAHVTFHLGDDRSWTDTKFADYAKHNRAEIERVFDAMLAGEHGSRMVSRLLGAHRMWVFPPRLRARAGIVEPPEPAIRTALRRWAEKARRLWR